MQLKLATVNWEKQSDHLAVKIGLLRYRMYSSPNTTVKQCYNVNSYKMNRQCNKLTM